MMDCSHFSAAGFIFDQVMKYEEGQHEVVGLSVKE